MSNSLLPHRLQQARLLCPSLSPRVCSNSCPCPTRESVMPSNRLILCHPLLLPPSIFPSIRVFSSESALRIRWPKYWSFSFNVSHSNEYPGLISFRMDLCDLLAVQGTLKSLLAGLRAAPRAQPGVRPRDRARVARLRGALAGSRPGLVPGPEG